MLFEILIKQTSLNLISTLISNFQINTYMFLNNRINCKHLHKDPRRKETLLIVISFNLVTSL